LPGPAARTEIPANQTFQVIYSSIATLKRVPGLTTQKLKFWGESWVEITFRFHTNWVKPDEESAMKKNQSLFCKLQFRWLVVAVAMLSLSAASFGQVFISVRIGPPALPVYDQPLCPGPGYLWTPGYWAWNDDAGYYWVPGTWVVAPVGLLWTPGYWGWSDGLYVWHAGYWGPHVGFYGGINYGFGYSGIGFVGGEWRGGAFFYNTAVVHVDTVHVTNVYVNRTVIVNNESHVAFNGGEGGVAARPTAEEERYSHEQHTPALAAQTEHEHSASLERANFASENHGRPTIAATARPGEFSGRGVVGAKRAGGEYHAPATSPKEARGPATRAENPHTNTASRTFTPPNKAQAGNARPENTNNNRNESRNTSRESKPAPKPKPAPKREPEHDEHKGR
jgi:WXXGXW repeat (2 copies)